MIEKKKCVICGFEVIILNCHYTCENCGFSENCHDKPHIIDSDDNGFTLETKDGLKIMIPKSSVLRYREQT